MISVVEAIPIEEVKTKPDWFKIRPPTTVSYDHIKQIITDKNLHTICTEGHCPNINECWSGGTATFMILGDTCTRGCRFCNVKTDKPCEWPQTGATCRRGRIAPPWARFLQGLGCPTHEIKKLKKIKKLRACLQKFYQNINFK